VDKLLKKEKIRAAHDSKNKCSTPVLSRLSRNYLFVRTGGLGNSDNISCYSTECDRNESLEI